MVARSWEKEEHRGIAKGKGFLFRGWNVLEVHSGYIYVDYFRIR